MWYTQPISLSYRISCQLSPVTFFFNRRALMEAVLQGPAGRTTLGTGLVTLGRAPDNQLVINDSKASSHHAEIRFVGQDYTITDLGSTNGTFVNEQRLERNVPRSLHAGDNIRIGDTLLTYEVTGAMAGAPADPGSSFQYQPTLPARPPEHTAYGAGAQQEYPPPQQSYTPRSEEHTSELQSRENLVCRLLLEKKKKNY